MSGLMWSGKEIKGGVAVPIPISVVTGCVVIVVRLWMSNGC